MLDHLYSPIYMQHTFKHIDLLIRLGIVSCCLPGAWHPSEPIGKMGMRSQVEIACTNRGSQWNSGAGNSAQEDPRDLLIQARSSTPAYARA